LGVERGAMLAGYTRARHSMTATTIEASAVGTALIAWVRGLDERAWRGTATELLALLSEYADESVRRDKERWPQSSQALTGALRRLAPALRAAGIGVDWPLRTARARMVRISRLEPAELGTGSSHTSSRHRRLARGAE